MTRDVTSSGDLSLAGSESPPVAVADAEDVFLRPESVAGDVHVTDAEYVFTHQSVGRGADPPAPQTRIRGDEDAYVDPGGVAGDLTLSTVADVFVPREAAGGDLVVLGAENVYAAEAPAVDGEWDVVTHGWQQTASGSAPETGVAVTGADHTVEIERTREDVDVYVVGWGHQVSLEGRGAEVTVHFCGYDNTVSVGPYLSATVETDAGFDNAVEEEPFPVEALVERTRTEAYRTAGFGRHKVIFQQPATDEEWCPNCGEAADAIVERHQLEAFFLFWRPVYVYERSTTPARECGHCSPHATDATLSREERREVFR